MMIVMIYFFVLYLSSISAASFKTSSFDSGVYCYLLFVVYRFGPRFPAMSGCYDKGLRCIAMEIAKQLGVASIIQEGVYAMVGGPNFESIAEARMLHRLGVDAVGTPHTHTLTDTHTHTHTHRHTYTHTHAQRPHWQSRVLRLVDSSQPQYEQSTSSFHFLFTAVILAALVFLAVSAVLLWPVSVTSGVCFCLQVWVQLQRLSWQLTAVSESLASLWSPTR